MKEREESRESFRKREYVETLKMCLIPLKPQPDNHQNHLGTKLV